MKMNRHLKNIRLGILALGCALLASQAAKANLTIHVDIDTSTLIGDPNGPFYLDFQLNDGSGTLDGINTVGLSNFVFTGGSAAGSANLFGGAAGDLATGITLDDSASSFNEFFQQFSAGTSHIAFDASLTTVVDAGLTPDAFLVAILDNTTGNPQIATNAPDGVSLLTLDIDHTNPAQISWSTFTSTAPAGVTLSTTPVPEPSTTCGLTLGICALALVVARRRMKMRA